MAFGWTILIIGISAGVVLRFKGLAIPLLIEIVRYVTGSHTAGNGENIAPEAAFAGVVGSLIGVVGVIAGVIVRTLGERMRTR